jgi:carboxymethylenebutenolidase
MPSGVKTAHHKIHTMIGRMTEFRGNGSTYQGYLAPCREGTGPGVIVIQEWWGLVGHIKEVADRFSEAGFTALAPDFYDGKTTTEPDEAGSLMMALNIDEAGRVIKGAVDALVAEPSTAPGPVGVVGFCMGGQLALYAACIDGRIGACVDFYGVHPNVKPAFEHLRGPVLGLFAEDDPYAGPEQVRGLADQLQAHGKDFHFETFPGTQHAFFNDDRPQVYHSEAAAKAWRMTVEFLRQNLTRD